TFGKLGRVAVVAAGVLLLGAAAAAGYRSGWTSSKLNFLPRSAQTPAAGRVVALPNLTPHPPPAGRPAPALASDRVEQPEPATGDGLKALVTRTLALWGVNEEPPDQGAAAWPVGPDGLLDVPAIAARYQLAATQLPETSLDELRAVNLPAILAMNGKAA